MKTQIRLISLSIVIVIAVSAWAVPAYRGWQERTLTDGTPVTIRLVGDEFYHFWETQDGKIATMQEDGTFIISPEYRPSAKAIKHNRATSPYMTRPIRKVGEHNMAPRGLVILVNFANVSFNAANDQAAFNDLMNSTSYTHNGAYGSVREYFRAQSNGAYVPDFDVVGPITLSNNRSTYGANTTSKKGSDVDPAQMIADACTAVNSTVNFATYDNDNDGYIDFVYVIYAGEGEADGGPAESVWPHNWYVRSGAHINCQLDGKWLDNYACSAELNHSDGSRTGIGTIAHEFGHVIGMPDYYDTDYGTNDDDGVTPYKWSIMDQGSYSNEGRTPPNYSIFDKYYMGWATPKFLAKDAQANVTMTTGYSDGYQITGGTSLLAYSNTNTIYYIENRQKTGWDAYIPGSGMLVWKVKYSQTVWEDNEPNSEAGNPRYTIVPADGKSTNYGRNASDLFPTGSVTSYTPFTGCALTEIAKSSSNVTFKYNGGVSATEWSYTLYGDHCTYPDDGTVLKNAALNLTITPSSGYTLADASCWEVTMGGTPLTYGADFTYNTGTGAFSIASVTGDVEILVEGKRTVTWNVAGVTNTTFFSEGAALVLPTKPADCSGSGGKKFVGWTANSTVTGSAPADLFSTAGTKTVTTNTTYYAVYATASSGGGSGAFDGSTAGNYKIYADVSGTKYYATGTGSKISSTTTVAEATEYTFSKVTGGWTIQNGSTYITYSSSTNLGTSASAYIWTISAGTEGTWRINSGTSGRAWIYRAGTTNKFGGYSTSNVNGTEYFDLEIEGGSGTTYSDYSLTCTTCTLSSIALNTSGATTVFTQGDAFSADGLAVTASYSDCSDRTVSPTSVSSPDMSTTGVKTITVSYTEGEVTRTNTYNITVNAAPTYKIRFYDGATKLKEEDLVSGATATPPSNPAGCTEYTFYGWWTETLASSNTTAHKVTDFTVSGAQDYYAVYSHTVTSGGGAASLTKQGSTSSFAAGDNIVIVAKGTTYALYQETVSTSYVKNWSFENSAATVGTDAKNYVTLATAATSGKWYLGDATNGYLYNTSGGNELYVKTDGSKAEWTISWNAGQSAFTIVGGRNLSCRTDLTGGNANKYRSSNGTGTGTCYFDIYKYSSGGSSTTNYTTTAECVECTNKVTLTKGTPSNGTFALDKADGEYNNCAAGGLVVTVSGITPADGYRFKEITQTGIASGVTIDQEGKTVTYAKDVKGASTINVVFELIPTYTVSFNAGSGNCTTPSLTEASAGAGVELPSATHNCVDWTFAGWAETSAGTETTVKPTLYAAGSTYYPTSNGALYAVYQRTEGGGTGLTQTFNFASIAEEDSWDNGTAYTTVTLGVVTLTANGGGNNGKYYTSNSSWRIYNGGSVSISVAGGEVTAVSSTPSKDFTITDGVATFAPSATTEFTNIDVTYSAGTTYYHSTPSCVGLQVTPTSLDYGTKNISTNTNLTITVTGTELAADASLTISGANAGMFSVSPTTLLKNGSNEITGSNNVTVTYHPTAEGTHSAILTITSGSFTKTVTLSGSCALVCTTPTLTFGGTSSVSKVLGSGKFTLEATSPNNTLGAAITYSSSNTSKATVDENTGEVTLKEATGSGSPVTITATLAAKNTGVACQNQVTTSYTLTIYNKVTWQVGEDEYTGGSPTTQTTQGGQITTFPTNPDGDALCGGKVFIGWTDHEVVDPVDVSPTPMYKALSDLSSIYITSNKTFYAVFAAISGGGGATPTLTKMNSGDTFSNGENIVIVAKYGSDNIAVYQETTSSTYVQTWTFDNNAATVAADDKNWFTVSTATGGWYLGDATNGYLNNSGNNLYCDEDQTVWELVDNSDGSFKLLSADNRYLSYRHDLSTTKWRMGGTDLGTSGATNLYIYKYSGSSTTYSDYSTTCGTCLPAPTAPTVTPKSNRATITWAAVPDATGYTVTCTGGSVSVVGTTATITGLTAETSYDFTIRSQGSDPYSCFPAYHGSFTTTSCEDSPVLGTVAVTPTTAAISWTCEAATATVRVYEDAECNTQVGGDYTLCTSPFTVTSLTSNTTYYYKVYAGGTCVSPVGSFTTEEIKLDIAEWQTDAVVVSFNGEADLTLTTYTEETHGDPHANVADDIFFSKYFEAALNVKLLAVFNGTMSSVDLSNYQLGLAQAGKGISVTQTFSFKKFSEFVKKGGGGLTEDELLLKPNEELILISYTDGDDDDIIACAQNDEEHSKFSTYIRISTPELQFNGDDVIALLNPDGDMIDLIGAGTKAAGLDRNGDSFIYRSSGTDYNGFMDQPGGWYTANGYHALTGNAEEDGYPLSSNRCLLIRRKHVKSGHNAVLHNQTDFLTLGDYNYLGTDYEGEWKGVQIPGSTTAYPYAAIGNSCTGFEVVGGYNYNDYYVDYEINGTPTTFDDLKSDPFDGTYIIPVTGLVDKACTMVRVELTDGSDNLVIRKDVKVPIMISGDQNTTDDIFHSNDKDAIICRECDVVILGTGTLTKVADGTTGDINRVRDLKIYQGGKLVVPSGTNYTVNSLAFRRQEDQVATADIQGGLTINENDAVYLDIRIDPTNWHYISLPYDCNVSDITFSTGEPATLGTDYLLKWYDGDKRAATQSGGCWEMVGASSVLKKGIGYIIALPGDGIVKKEFRFPMANGVIADDQNDKLVQGIYGYGCDKDYTQVRANHRGWNLVGNPYFLPYQSTIENPVLNGEIVEDHSVDPWDGHYKFNDPVNDLRYIVEPVNNGWSEYRQVAITNYSMTPFTSYFVQIGGTDPAVEQGIQFVQTQVTGRSSIVRRSPAENEEKEDTHPVWCAVTLTNVNGEKDETTMLISNDFTDNYDIMNDLVKMRGSYYQYKQITTKPVLASRNNEGEMAFNALPDSSALAGIPLNYFAAFQGEYVFAYDNKYDRDGEVKEVKLLDTKTNTWYDLMSESYAFTTNREDNTTRFILSIRIERKTPHVATDLDLTNTPDDRPRKILINDHVYIQRGGAIYDITGKQVLNY